MEILKYAFEKMMYIGDLFGVTTGYFFLFIVSLIGGWIGRKKNSLFFVSIWGVSIGILIAIYNPVVILVLDKIVEMPERYVRVFWLLPIPLVLAYSAVKLSDISSRLKYRNFLKIIIIVLFIVFGKLVINRTEFKMPDNWYKIPQEVVDICDLLPENVEKYRIAADTSLSAYMKQYNGNLRTLYGRRNVSYSTVYDLMQQTPLNIALITRYSRIDGCECIIINKQKAWTQPMEDCGYELFAETIKYAIYMDAWNEDGIIALDDFSDGIKDLTGEVCIKMEGTCLLVYNLTKNNEYVLVQKYMLDTEGEFIYNEKDDSFELLDKEMKTVIHVYKKDHGFIWKAF